MYEPRRRQATANREHSEGDACSFSFIKYYLYSNMWEPPGRAGEVLRMPMDRLPRKLLTAWLPCKRAVGAMHNWGNTLNKALTSKGITTTFHKLSTLANQTTSLRGFQPSISYLSIVRTTRRTSKVSHLLTALQLPSK